jgi:hypothetical protein
MDEHHKMLVAAAAICIHQLLVSYFIIFDDVPTASEARAAKKHKRELTPCKRNLSVEYGRLTTNLEHVLHLERILQDMNRPYMKDVTHLHGWQFFSLLIISRISSNAQDCVLMVLVLQTTFTVNVSLIIFITCITV